MGKIDWLTNDTDIAARLRRADRQYDLDVAKASGLVLAEKVRAIRAARQARDNAYQDLIRETVGL